MKKKLILLSISILSLNNLKSATITVTSTNNSGAGSLREAITNAVAGDIITLNTSDTIKLSSEIVISKNLSITRTGQTEKIISGNGVTRIFNVSSGVNLSVSNLTIARGFTNGNGAGILSSGNLTITNCLFAKNRAEIKGGGICADPGISSITNCSFEQNNCYNNTNSNTHIPYGGGVHVGRTATVVIDRCNFFQNYCRSASWTVGGALSIEGNGTVKNSTLAFNSLESTNSNYQCIGAGIGIMENAQKVNIFNNTIVYNNVINGANSGAGIGTWQMGSHDINSNIIYGNTYMTNSAMDIRVGQSGNKGSGGYNLIGTYGGNFVVASTDILNTNPSLGAYALNGGQTKNYSIACTSPAYKNGKPLHTGSSAQNGVSRGSRVDIGAYSWAGSLPTATIATTNPSCFGGTNGGAVATGQSTNDNVFTFVWTGNVSGPTINNLGAGTYKLYMTDDNLCTDSISFTLTQPSALTLSGLVTNDFGTSNGSITVNSSGGISPYTYLWTPTSTTNKDISNIAHGNYNVTVTDANGCIANKDFEVSLITSVNALTNTINWSLYPNPANNEINLDLNESSTLTVFNVMGEIVSIHKANEGKNTINISNLNSGVYFIQTNKGENTRFVKE